MTDDQASRPAAASGSHDGPQGTRVIKNSDLPDIAKHDAPSSDPIARDVFLVGLVSPFEGQFFPIEGEEVRIGRQAHNDIVLDDPGISWEHAQLVHTRYRWRVLNVLSTNGTFVNGGHVHEAELADGDELSLGPIRFQFRQLSTATETSTPGGGNGWLNALVIAALILAIGLAGLLATIGL